MKWYTLYFLIWLWGPENKPDILNLMYACQIYCIYDITSPTLMHFYSHQCFPQVFDHRVSWPKQNTVFQNPMFVLRPLTWRLRICLWMDYKKKKKTFRKYDGLQFDNNDPYLLSPGWRSVSGSLEATCSDNVMVVNWDINLLPDRLFSVPENIFVIMQWCFLSLQTDSASYWVWQWLQSVKRCRERAAHDQIK